MRRVTDNRSPLIVNRSCLFFCVFLFVPRRPRQNVLRELEMKKPQLDELVQTAEGIKDGGGAPTKPQAAQGTATDSISISPFETCARV